MAREFPDFDDNLRQAFQRETEMLFESILREDRSVSGPSRCRLHFRERAPGQALRHRQCLWSRFPARSRSERCPPRSAGTRKHAAGHLQRQSHFSGAARQMDSGKSARQPASLASAQRSAAQGELGRDSRPHRFASAWSSIAPIRPAPGATKLWTPSGSRSRISTASANGATVDSGFKIDASGQLVDGTRVDGPASLRKALLDRPEAFVGTMTEKLLMYGVGRETKYYDMPVVRAVMRGCRRRSLPVLRPGVGNCEERAVSDENERSRAVRSRQPKGGLRGDR